MFGKRPSANETSAPRQAPPPAGEELGLATRPKADPPKAERGPAKPVAGPKPTPAFEQLRAAQGPAPTTQVVREQSDYYHSTKT
ncbi:MAG: protein kinase, partial [Phenylobacterium sp.]|nr:protein kinase [Phenylobacterium sp.]